MFTIPTSSDPFYTQVSDFDGVNYNLQFRYNQREECWYLSIADDIGNDIVNGVKIVCSIPLLRRFSDTRLPPGELIAAVNGPDDSPPSLTELGAGLRVELHYVPIAEITALVAKHA